MRGDALGAVADGDVTMAEVPQSELDELEVNRLDEKQEAGAVAPGAKVGLLHLEEAGCIGAGACCIYLGKGFVDTAGVDAECEKLRFSNCGLRCLS